MKKDKRRDGDGTYRQRSDGRWECRIMTGRRSDGHLVYKYLYGKTQRELKDNVKAWKEDQIAGCLWNKEYFFRDWAEIWFEHHKDNISATTQCSYRYTLNVLIDYFGDRKLDSIKAFDVETFLKQLRREGGSRSRLTQCRGMLFQIFHKAEANDLVHKNPVRFADKMRNLDPITEKDCFTVEEVKLLMANLPNDRIGASIRLMLGTGMRTQEILALEPRHIEEDGSVIQIRQAINMVGGTAVVGVPKSRDSYRDIPVPPVLRPYALYLRNAAELYIWQSDKMKKPVNPTYFRKLYKAAIDKIDGVRYLSPHSCRHTYVSQLQALGVDMETIKSIVGHADLDRTRHYLHVQEPVRKAAALKLSDAFSLETKDD